jgi:hypothetical protein
VTGAKTDCLGEAIFIGAALFARNSPPLKWCFIEPHRSLKSLCKTRRNRI